MEHLDEEIEQALRAVDWTAHGADPAEVISAVRQLWLVRSEQEGQDAYNAVLDAVGHNHSGWLFDAAGPAAAILAAVVRTTRDWARRTALEILLDCLAWVRPEQRFIDADGHARDVNTALRDAVTSLEAELYMIVADSNTSVPLAKSAHDLLQALHGREM